MRKLLLLLILTSCSTISSEKDCRTINNEVYCRTVNDDEQFLTCVNIQQSIFRGQEESLPAYCYKFEKRFEMTHFIKR